MLQLNYINSIGKCLLVGICSLVAYFEPIYGAIHIFLVAFALDFITGILASFSKGEQFKSSKARWSFAKLLCYTGSLMFILLIAKNLHAIYTSHSDYEMLMWVIKMAVYAGVWFESKSIVENLLVLSPTNTYLRFVDYILGVEFARKLPGLSEFLKEDKVKHGEQETEDSGDA